MNRQYDDRQDWTTRSPIINSSKILHFPRILERTTEKLVNSGNYPFMIMILVKISAIET